LTLYVAMESQISPGPSLWLRCFWFSPQRLSGHVRRGIPFFASIW
jgi:hypothetical protein